MRVRPNISGLWVWLMASLLATRSFAVTHDESDPDAESATADGLITTWIDALATGSRLMIYLAAVIGIGMVSLSIFRLAVEQDSQRQWRHVGGIVVGSFMTIFGVVVGVFSILFAPGAG